MEREEVRTEGFYYIKKEVSKEGKEVSKGEEKKCKSKRRKEEM